MTVFPPSLIQAASASGISITRDSFIWDSGASNHFINKRSAFSSLNKLETPFTFDQAIDKTSLNYAGTALITIGKLNLLLGDALYSPKSSINLISAGRAFRLAKISEDCKAGLLIRSVNGR